MKDIYLSSVNHTGLLQCVVEACGGTVWMYLHDLTKQCVVGDAPVCSFVPPVSVGEFKQQYRRGDTPPLVKEFSTNRAVVADIETDRIVLRWSRDGCSVVALIDGEPFVMIIAGQKKGLSKAISRSGPWANPWDDDVYKRIFGEKLNEKRTWK